MRLTSLNARPSQGTKPSRGFMRRGDNLLPLELRHDSPLPPRDMFSAYPDVLTEYDELVRLNATTTQQYRAARVKKLEAQQSRDKYAANVRAAMEAGRDPAKVKRPDIESLEAAAAEHLRFGERAAGLARQQGAVLGAAVQLVALDLIPTADDHLAAAGDELDAALADLTTALERWSAAWSLRKWLSAATYRGGRLAFDPKPGVDAGKRAALDTLAAASVQLEHLREDETAVRQWRTREGTALSGSEPTSKPRLDQSDPVEPETETEAAS